MGQFQLCGQGQVRDARTAIPVESSVNLHFRFTNSCASIGCLASVVQLPSLHSSPYTASHQSADRLIISTVSAVVRTIQKDLRQIVFAVSLLNVRHKLLMAGLVPCDSGEVLGNGVLYGVGVVLTLERDKGERGQNAAQSRRGHGCTGQVAGENRPMGVLQKAYSKPTAGLQQAYSYTEFGLLYVSARETTSQERRRSDAVNHLK